MQSEWAPGTLERSRRLLRLCGQSFPTETLRNAYFENLRSILQRKPKRAEPGRLVLGTGAGRCGSTTLSGAFAGLPEACSTHENPPVVYWIPPEEQLQFQIDRFRLLVQYYGIVFDACHGWLNVLPRLFGEFPGLKVIGLYRDVEPCVASFLRQKGLGKQTINHWATLGNGIWTTSPGDPWYPTYAVPNSLLADPDAAKRAMIWRYVTEYNQALQETAAAHHDRVLLVRTEELSDPQTAARMSQFLGFELRMPAKSLNVGDAKDSDKVDMTF
jgi:hypothetical protein